MKEQLVKVFKEKFGSEGDIRSYFAPGRVNLIGEHTVIMAVMYFHVH